MLHNIAMNIAYDGTNYVGWQKTPTGQNIEEALQSVLEQILQHPIHLQAASRTDGGVHAQGQVVNFYTSHSDLDLGRLRLSLNQLMDSSIAVLELRYVPHSFHPTLDNKGKEYHYFLCVGPAQLPHLRHYSWHCPYSLDLPAMQQAAQHLLGERDFAALCNFKKNAAYQNTIREISAINFTELPEYRLRIAVKGNHFLYKMVRNIVGLLVAVGKHKLDSADIPQILASHDRTRAAVTAPAHGLTLYKVFFD